MEELKVALTGNSQTSLPCVLHDTSASISVDSLDSQNSRKKKGRNASKSYESLCLLNENPEEGGLTSFYIHPQSNESFLSDRSSKDSVKSDPTPRGKVKMNFVQSAMADYLNSHRHSLSSLMEIMHVNEREDHGRRRCESEKTDSYDQESFLEKCPSSYAILSPIEENSEPSTRSSSCRNSSSSEKRKANRILSTSCDPIPSEPLFATEKKYQTFPRRKTSDEAFSSDCNYPLEPREIDPFAYHQLHTADSQEELQEFLLLESECMSDINDRGLASAFTISYEECDTVGLDGKEGT